MMFQPGALKNKIVQQTKVATDNGILVPAQFEREDTVLQCNVPYVVRIAANLQHKDKARKDQDDKTRQLGQEPNPFLPYKPIMFVSDLSPTHICLLNRFKLFDYPLLIVTREFEKQESELNYDDFHSISICLQEMNGVAFYNGGLKAGATQRHKHFHFIPYPLGDNFSTVPIDGAIRESPMNAELFSLEILPYQHLISRISWSNDDSPETVARMLLAKYQRLMNSMVQNNSEGAILSPQYSYNLIVTRHWMKLALRSAPAYESISLNALGFAGIFNVRSEVQVNKIKELLPLKILQGIGVPR